MVPHETSTVFRIWSDAEQLGRTKQERLVCSANDTAKSCDHPVTISIRCVSPVDDNFDERLQHWKLADAEASEAGERLRVALMQGVDSEKAAELHGELLRRRDYADSLITELVQDMNRRPGEPGQ